MFYKILIITCMTFEKKNFFMCFHWVKILLKTNGDEI